MVYKIVNDSAPNYMSNCIERYIPPRPLRSSKDTTRLIIPTSNYVHFGKRFAVLAPTIWNSLPQNIRELPSMISFKAHLKTHLFPVL